MHSGRLTMEPYKKRRWRRASSPDSVALFAGHERFFSGTVDRVVFGPAEYQWHSDPVPADAVPPSGQAAGATGAGGAPDGDDSAEGGRRRRVSGHASPDGPPSVSTIKAGGPDTLYELPKASIIVLRGKVATY
jgi:uncharacterized protein with LGFP repeats